MTKIVTKNFTKWCGIVDVTVWNNLIGVIVVNEGGPFSFYKSEFDTCHFVTIFGTNFVPLVFSSDFFIKMKLVFEKNEADMWTTQLTVKVQFTKKANVNFKYKITKIFNYI